MKELDELRARLPEAARDIKINLQTVLKPGTLSLEQVLGVALACAHTTRCALLIRALESVEGVGEAIKADAHAAAVLMAMNNVYYRSRHLLGGVIAEKSPRLRMQRMASAANRGDFELCCFAVSALAGCPTCLLAHEASCLRHGLSDEHVHEALRIASVINAAAVALACEPGSSAQLEA